MLRCDITYKAKISFYVVIFGASREAVDHDLLTSHCPFKQKDANEENKNTKSPSSPLESV